ncbi:MAG: site-specific DNA-methyltransferase [Hydrotalea flava]|nr:site-specific DNA-methyltransferase [Hydrotalea flava]NIM39309.1 site-specific DNA-methyltransferase [Hydrotalea flava]NIN04235.1 site-specific DNA-methyltransferase [Hydrotalea flava]NIN16170.1 site-specific DNA-methyltransferase [Hydrotalea flava]NIO95235.1 site-specific DNA-methyltransferase [Hydrotalea flava]
MTELPDNSVHLAITSPPYWQLKDYGTDNQIGFHDSYENYINNLNLVWKECYRTLHNGCRLCVNIGDQFARAVYYGRYKVIPIREEIIKFCENIGFDYMGAIIWQKVTTSNTTGGGVQMGSYPYPRNGILKLDYEFILVFKKLGDAPKPTKEQKELSKMTAEEWNTYFAGHWNFAGARQNNHIAMFPEELPKRLIKMFSFVGETVLDPFAGSGTTALAAKNLDRNSIGYEINPEFIPFIKEKLETHQKDLSGTTYNFIKQKGIETDFEKEIQKLPYIFKDPHTLDKKIDVKKLQFGSRIDKNSSTQREEFYTVKEIISPEKVRLNNDLTIKLIGIKEDPIINGDATNFLKEKTKGKRVFIRYDEVKHDKENNLLCYLYLENKTFINAHLIKNGLVQVDSKTEFKYKDKFQQLFNQAHFINEDNKNFK